MKARWILVVLLAGCSDVFESELEVAAAADAAADVDRWTIFRGDAGLSGVASGALPDRLALLWTYEAGGGIVSSPVVANGRVYFGADDSKLHCVEVETGEGDWAFETEDIIEAPPLIVDGTVYVGSSDMALYAIRADGGRLRWKAPTEDKILGGANSFRDEGKLRIVVGSYDSHLYCFDAENGDLLWRYATDNYVNGTPAIDGAKVAFGGCDAALHVVSVVDGEGVKAIPLESDAHVAGSIALVDGRAYFGHYGNRFVCIDLESDETVWEYGNRFPFFSSPAVGPERVLFGGRDKQLHCVRRSDGEPLWTFKTGRKVDGSPVLAGDRVVFGSEDGRLYVVALEDGAELWTYDIGKALIASPAVVGGRIFVGATDGRLYAFGEAPEDDER